MELEQALMDTIPTSETQVLALENRHELPSNRCKPAIARSPCQYELHEMRSWGNHRTIPILLWERKRSMEAWSLVNQHWYRKDVIFQGHSPSFVQMGKSPPPPPWRYYQSLPLDMLESLDCKEPSSVRFYPLPARDCGEGALEFKEWEAGQNGNISEPVPSTLQTPAIKMPSPMIYCNTDASWKSDTKLAGLGWIFTDNEGQ